MDARLPLILNGPTLPEGRTSHLPLSASSLFIYQSIFIPVTRIQTGRYVTGEEMCCAESDDVHI